MSAFGSLSLANRGTAGVLFGQSNANRCGNKTGVSGLSKPAGATWWLDGVSKAAFDTAHHGPEQGLLDELCTVNGKTITLVQRGIDGTTLALWNSTHCATLIADCVTAGVVPKWGVLVQGEAEAAANEASSLAWADTLVNVRAKLCAAWGAAFALVVVRIRTTDGTGYPWHATVRTVQDTTIATWNHIAGTNVDDSPLDVDLVHYTSATAILAGRRAARLLLNAGVVP